MSEETEVIKSMQKVRRNVISHLKKDGFELGTHYKLSTASNDPEFVLSIIKTGKSNLGTTITRIDSSIKKGFADDISTGMADNKILKLKVLNYIEPSTEEIAPAPTETEEDKENNSVGRPKTEFGIFRDELISYIEDNTNLIANHGAKGFWTTCPTDKGNELHRWVLIHCPLSIITFDIAKVLENNPYYLKRMSINVKSHTLHISMNEKPQTEEKVIFVKSFFEHIEDFVRKFDFDFVKIQTPFSIIAFEDPAEISFEFNNSESAYAFIQKINKDWKPQKQGAIATINVTKLQMQEFINDEKKILGEEKKQGLLTKESDNSFNSYIRMSKNYKEFHFLPFNRTRIKKHTMKIVKSMKKYGVLSFVIIVNTDCIDGTMRKWIVDGQHRFDALQYLQLPILYTETTVHSKEEMVRLIAELNRTSKNWSLKDYLGAWKSLAISQYLLIDYYLTKTKLPITVLLEIFSGLSRRFASELFQDGKFEIKDIKKSEKQISELVELRKFLPKSREILSAVVEFLNINLNYNHEVMKKNLAENKDVKFTPGDVQEEVLKKLDLIYRNV